MENIINNIVKVRSSTDIKNLEKLSKSELATKHLYIICNFGDVSEPVKFLCENSLVYSVISNSDSLDFDRIASKIDTVPFFVIHNENEVVNLVIDLVRDPFQTIKKAINSGSVALRYHEGLPS